MFSLAHRFGNFINKNQFDWCHKFTLMGFLLLKFLLFGFVFSTSCIEYVNKIPSSFFHVKRAAEGICSFAEKPWFDKLKLTLDQRQDLSDKLDSISPPSGGAGGVELQISSAIIKLFDLRVRTLFETARELSQIIGSVVVDPHQKAQIYLLTYQLKKLSGSLLNVYLLKVFLYENFLAVDKEIAYKSVLVDIHDAIMTLFWEDEMCMLELPNSIAKCDAKSLSDFIDTRLSISGVKEPFEKTLEELISQTQDKDISDFAKELKNNLKADLLFVVLSYLELIAKCIVLYNRDRSKGTPPMDSIRENYLVILQALLADNNKVPSFIRYRAMMIGEGLANEEFNSQTNLPWYRDNGLIIMSAALTCLFVTGLTFVSYHFFLAK